MRIKFILALLLLIFACALQAWFASIGVFIDLILATTIIFALFFDIWELLIFVLFSVLVINWQPAFSVEILLFGLIPLIVQGFYRFFGLIAWATAPFAIIFGFLFFYLGVAPTMFLVNIVPFSMDLFGGLIFGTLVYLALGRANK